MKSLSTTPKSLQLFFLLILFSTLCSFSSVPVASVIEEQPPVEKRAESKRQKRLNKRYNRLHKRFDQAKNSKKQLHIQKKIRQVERQKADEEFAIMGLIGMLLGIVSLILACFAFISLFTNVAIAGTVFLIGFLLSITGLVLSIISVAKENSSMKGFGIAGIILNAIALFISVITGIVLFIIAALSR